MHFKVALQIIYITLSCFVALLEDSFVVQEPTAQALYVTSVFLVITFGMQSSS